MNFEYRDSSDCKAAGITYHLAIEKEWHVQSDNGTYTPSAFDADGFIHCTNGLDLLTDIANMFYKDSPELRTVLVLDVRRISSDMRYDDPHENFPHVYGSLNPAAVVGELPVERDENGTFVLLGNRIN